MALASISGTIIRKSELGDGNPSARAFAKPFLKSFETFPLKQLMQRRERLQDMGVELGMHFKGADTFSSETTFWKLDVLPRILSRQEWEFLENGLVQRARAFDALLRDLYSTQRILKDRIIPFDLIFDDPAFLYPCHGVLSAKQPYLTMGAVDLVRDRKGQWMVTGNHYSTPVGLSYILQNRRMLAQTIPELFESMDVEPISGFSSDLIEVLAQQSGKSKPRIVLLTSGGIEPVTFEEAFLARRMGIPIVEPSDLLVRNHQIVLKTVGGLKPIDVIYRRMPSIELDPIAFGSHGRGGIPGLLNCVRRGTVTIVNAIGCGVADNKALLPYSDQIIQYYLGEIPLLPTVPTYICRDPDQRLEVEEKVDDLLLKPVHREHETGGLYEGGDRKTYHQRMKKLLKSHPKWVVAQPFIDASQYPRFIEKKLVNRPAYLRAFTLLGERPMALPGGLTRQALASDPYLYVADFATGTKDTWIPTGKKRKRNKKQKSDRQRPIASFSDFPVSSRVAENLYWMGRYSERAEHTARMVDILVESGWKHIGKRERSNLWPLWQAARQASGDTTTKKRKTPPKEIIPIARQLILDDSYSGSAYNNLKRAHWNAAEIREFITPEVWTCLNHFTNSWDEIPYKGRIAPARLQPICEDAVYEFARLNGTINRTMPHDDGWECYRIGILLERAISTTTSLGIVLPHALRHTNPRSHEDPDLTTLLRMLGSLDAYHREYRSRTYARLVAELLWKNDETPNALAYCLRYIFYGLEALHDRKRNSRSSSLTLVRELKSQIRKLDLETFFPNRSMDSDQVSSHETMDLEAHAQSIERFTGSVNEALGQLHTKIEDRFFAHLSGAH
ncbi:MAG: circularly permuted type 2 ATP-grasp protein [Verrucomicrobiota bacterium]